MFVVFSRMTLIYVRHGIEISFSDDKFHIKETVRSSPTTRSKRSNLELGRA